MAVISPPILKLLSDLDIDLMDVDSDMDYLRALMEATNSLTISNPSDRRIPILQKEVKRVIFLAFIAIAFLFPLTIRGKDPALSLP